MAKLEIELTTSIVNIEVNVITETTVNGKDIINKHNIANLSIEEWEELTSK